MNAFKVAYLYAPRCEGVSEGRAAFPAELDIGQFGQPAPTGQMPYHLVI